MKNFPLASSASLKDPGPDFYSKKRRRNKTSRYVDDRTRTVTFRAASAIILILATSKNAMTMSNGFGSPSIVQRPASYLYFSGKTKKFPSDGHDDGQDEEDDDDDDPTLLSTLPTDNTSGKTTDTDTSSQRNQSRSTSKNNRRNTVGNFDDDKNRDGSISNDSNNADIIIENSVPASSLLPPPINIKSKDQNSKVTTEAQVKDDKVSRGLSSWEDFLGGGTSSPSGMRENNRQNDDDDDDATSIRSATKEEEKKEKGSVKTATGDRNGKSSSNDVSKDVLPSIADLFPSDLSTSKPGDQVPSSSRTSDNTKDNGRSSSTPTLDGVLPVSDLFYRSVQSISDDSQNGNEDEDQFQRDDEELPFSAEQSDQLTTSLNKIKIRRNSARSKGFVSAGNNTNINNSTTTPNSSKTPKKRKLQRRGMEMLVGGVPINADPPQRCVELTYQHDKNVDWKDVIATNTRDFGPMYYGPSVSKLSKEEQGLYCEFFVNSTLKWNVCPKDLRAVLNKNDDVFAKEANYTYKIDRSENTAETEADDDKSTEIQEGSISSNSTESTMKEALRSRMVGSMKEAFRKASTLAEDKPFSVNSNAELSGELVFSIGVAKEELESSGDSQTARRVLERVLATGISTSSQCTGFDVAFSKLQLSDLGDGTTTISAEFILTIKNNASMSFAEVKKKCNQINSSLAQAMDDGDMQLAMAAAAKKEKAWSEELRNRMVEEFLFDDDDGDGPLDESNAVGEALAAKSTLASNGLPEQAQPEPNLESTIDSLLNDLNYEVQGFKKDRADGPFGMPGSLVYPKDDLFLGGGNDGVFWNYAADNVASAPYQGKLGLRLVDAVTEKAKQRHPRVIAIGDVHGCIDELQDLLRECDYRPGDLVVFLGDLVSKGPDSMAVVQMAREIGAIGVRGNHDFEVVRWHQAIKSGVDPPVVGSEHFHIANCLSKADMKWMYSLPWYISSPDLGALFVHAGFVSGIRLAKQNPRLMMNMRSILPDGTVTSKFFNNWPWARLWDGPQTVLFGHDADRGLQQYEHAIGLDTGCVYGGRLTACILPEKRLVSVNARREYFKYRRKHYD